MTWHFTNNYLYFLEMTVRIRLPCALVASPLVLGLGACAGGGSSPNTPSQPPPPPPPPPAPALDPAPAFKVFPYLQSFSLLDLDGSRVVFRQLSETEEVLDVFTLTK